MSDPRLVHAIDFGMWNCAIVVCRPDGTTVPIPDPARPLGPPSVPSSICVRQDGSIVLGVAAQNAGNEVPGAYRREFKRDFGDPQPSTLATRSMTADEMTVHMVRFLREQAQRAVPGDPERVIITVPVAWEAGNLDLMRAVAKRAGYEGAAVELVPEPVAALAHVFGDPLDLAGEFTALVYDLGGGTFDCALARGSSRGFEVLGDPAGIADLGGSDFDALLLGLLGERAGPSLNALLAGPARDAGVLARRLSLREESERIKCALSTSPEYEGVLTSVAPPVGVRILRGEFEALIQPLLAETVAACDRLLSRLGMDWPAVDRVVPVGGGSNIPLVRTLLARACGRAVLRVDDPGLAVVNGAAVLGAQSNVPAAPRGTQVNGYPRRQGMTLTSTDEQQPEIDAAERLIAVLENHRDKLPQQRKPNIMVCGETGTGKSTTINTLFGEEVSAVGDFTTGTEADEIYEWESKGQHIDVVDLPGLGDSPKHDRAYMEMYRRRVEKADGFIVVLAPPRPANTATIRTVNLLLSCGVNPERIVFAYNRLGDITAEIGGKRRQLRLDGIAGPASKDDLRVVEQARLKFHADLCAKVQGGKYAKRFPQERVVPYDALSGWNLFAVFDAVLETLPGDALVSWRDAVTRAAKDLQRRTEKRIRKANAEHRREMDKLKQENEKLASALKGGGDPKKDGSTPSADDEERERLAARQRALDEQARHLEEERESLRRQQQASSTIGAQRDRHVESIAERFVAWVAPAAAVVVTSVKEFGSRVARWWRG